MTERKIKWAVTGTSFISAIMADAILESEYSELTAVMSRSQATGKEFAARYGIAKVYDDYELLLQDKNIDAIYIGLPNHMHKAYTLRAIHAGKHVLCDKPFMLNAQDVQEVMDVLKNKDLICMEGLMYRHHPLTHKLQEIIQQNSLGEIKLIQAAYAANIAAVANSAAGGAIRNLGCYPVSLIRLLLQEEPVEIKALGRINQANNNDNQTCAIMKFQSDTMAVISIADDMEMFWQFEIYGSKGQLVMVSNPWWPEEADNKILITHYDNDQTSEVQVTADKPLFTYQIDCMCRRILKLTQEEGVTLYDSKGNAAVLAEWYDQIRHATLDAARMSSLITVS